MNDRIASPGTETESLADDVAGPPASGASFPVVSRDRYAIGEEFARGGGGRLLRARDRDLDRVVAIKEPLTLGSRVERRFLREAVLTARLQHPSIVPIHEIGRWPTGEPFYAMKLISGRTLREVVADTTTIEQRVALIPNVLAVADAVAYAHRQGVIHRDLKPSNVMIGAFGETQVIDWGLAKELGADDEGDTDRPPGLADETRGIVGSPTTMAPEQARGMPADERTDVYGIGALLYHVLAGAPPYRGDDPTAVRAMVASHAPPPLADRAPRAPRDLVAIAEHAMARDCADRYPNAGELADDLRRFLTGQLVRAHRYSIGWRLRRTVRRHRGAVFGVGVAMAAMVAGFAGLYASQVRRAPLCPSAQPQLAGVWDADRKAAIARALQASGKPWAGETASRIAGEIDRYGREWVAMRREACEATSVRHEQSEALLDLRMRCLDERLEEVRSLASQLSQPDEALLDAATTAVYSLAPMRDCADTKALLAPVPLPGDPAVRAEVEQVRASLTEAKAMSELGRYAEAEPLAAELVGRARALRYSPAEAETLEVWADALESLGQYPRAVETYREALFAAERGLDRKRAASAMINLLWIVGVDQGHHEAAHEYAAHAAAVLAGLGGDAVLEADLDSHEAGVFREEGHFDEAVKLAREVVEKRKVAFGTMHPRYAMALNNLAASLADQGRYPESLAASQEALAINAQTLGEHHPDYALSLQSVASDYNLLGRPAEARTLAGQALAVLEEALGTEHARVASAEWALALIEMKLDEGADAERHLRHAMAVAEKLQGPDQNAVAEYTSVLGDLLVREGRYAEAVPLYRRSLAIQAAAGQEPAECRAGLGYALLGVGQRAAALRELETALQWQETNHGTKRDLGQARLGVSRALSALGTDPKRAHALAEQAVEAYAADPGTDAELRVARDWLRGLDGGGATASAGH